MNIERLDRTVEDLRRNLKGMLATDIWRVSTGVSLAGFHSQPAAVELFGNLAQELADALDGAGFPGLHRYFLLDMEGDTSVLVIRHGDDILQGMLLNNKQSNLGMVLSLGLRTALEGVADARRLPSTEEQPVASMMPPPIGEPLDASEPAYRVDTRATDDRSAPPPTPRDPGGPGRF